MSRRLRIVGLPWSRVISKERPEERTEVIVPGKSKRLDFGSLAKTREPKDREAGF